MNEAPNKIWIRELPRKEDGVLIGLSYHTEPEGLENGTEHPYIRADIVDDLIKALIVIGAGQVDPKEFAIKALENFMEEE